MNSGQVFFKLEQLFFLTVYSNRHVETLNCYYTASFASILLYVQAKAINTQTNKQTNGNLPLFPTSVCGVDVEGVEQVGLREQQCRGSDPDLLISNPASLPLSRHCSISLLISAFIYLFVAFAVPFALLN